MNPTDIVVSTPHPTSLTVGAYGHGYTVSNAATRRELRRMYRQLRRYMERREARLFIDDILWMSMQENVVSRVRGRDARVVHAVTGRVATVWK